MMLDHHHSLHNLDLLRIHHYLFQSYYLETVKSYKNFQNREELSKEEIGGKLGDRNNDSLIFFCRDLRRNKLTFLMDEKIVDTW